MHRVRCQQITTGRLAHAHALAFQQIDKVYAAKGFLVFLSLGQIQLLVVTIQLIDAVAYGPIRLFQTESSTVAVPPFTLEQSCGLAGHRAIEATSVPSHAPCLDDPVIGAVEERKCLGADAMTGRKKSRLDVYAVIMRGSGRQDLRLLEELQLRYASTEEYLQRLIESRLGRALPHDVSYHNNEPSEDRDDQQWFVHDIIFIMASSQKPREWRTTISDQEYLISTDLNNISHDFVNNAYATDDMYWAKAMPAAILRNILYNSLVMGVYAVQPSFPPAKTAEEPSSPDTPSPTLEDPAFYFSNEFQGNGAPAEKLEQVGFGRFVTDHVTVFYLTDVYVEPDSRGKGLGKWLISCCREILDSKPHLMRAMLMASPGEGKQFYEKNLGMRDMQEEVAEGHVLPMTRNRNQ
ncbi:hypothetical protein KCV00_g287, partial [Aureobasidium melanogenum]